MAQVNFVRTNASVLLDLVRAAAAFLVLIGHGRNFLFIDYSDLPHHPLWLSLLYAVTKAGHQAVVIFFVLSGYLISGSVLRSVERHTWSWPSYLTQRLVRLWIVLIPGLLLCLLWDHQALAHHLAPSLYTAAAANHMGVDVANRLGMTNFLGNLFFLQGFIVPVFGSDTPLWSLAYEFWFYMLFPLGLFALARRTTLRIRILSVVGLLLIGWFVRELLPLFPVWLCGTVLLYLPTLRIGLTGRILATAVYAPILFACAAYHPGGLLGDYVLTLATLLYLWVLLSATTEARPTLAVRTTRLCARFSYTLYVVHMPLLLLLVSLFQGEARWNPTPLNLLKACGILTLPLLYSYAIASATEFHTDRLRHWIEAQWTPLHPPVPSQRTQPFAP